MIMFNGQYFYILLKKFGDRDLVIGSYLTKDEALRELLSLSKQIIDYLNEAIIDEGFN